MRLSLLLLLTMMHASASPAACQRPRCLDGFPLQQSVRRLLPLALPLPPLLPLILLPPPLLSLPLLPLLLLPLLLLPSAAATTASRPDVYPV